MHRRAVLPVLLFVLTGALGLGYQVLWSRDLLDLVGIGAWSQSAVLCCFMGGLALGSALLGPLADRVRRPLLLFGALEAAVGLYAFAYGALSRASSSWYLALAESRGAEGGEALLGIKLAVAGVLLLPPTILMGGSYPAIFRHLTPTVERAGRWSSGLYAANAFGAAAGAVLMAFWLLPALGLASSLRLLGTLNLAAGAVAAVLALTTAPVARADDDRGTPDAPSWRIRAALALLLLEGIAGFGLEIAWMRYFSVVLGSSVYSFAIVVAVFITGMGIGSLALAALDRRVTHPMAWFGSSQVALAALLILPLPLYPLVPWLFGRLEDTLSTTLAAFYLYESAKALVCFVVMLPATVVAGAALPLVVKTLSLESGRLGRSSGRAWAWDTVGNVLGAALAGTVLLPAVGMELLLRLCALWCALLGFLAVWLFSERPALRSRTLIVAASGTLLVTAGALALPRWRVEWFTLSPFLRAGIVPSLSQAARELRDREILMFRDDPAAHVMVARWRRKEASLWTNGKLEATSQRDLPTQLLLGHVPLLLQTHTTDVLVIGLASGVSCGAVLQHPVRSLDVVDVVRAMPEATRFFDDANHHALDDPRLRVVIDDARSYVATTARRFDVIVSEPSNVWVAGVASLFTVDHYRQASRVLRPGGLYVQWIQAYQVGDPTLATVVRSFIEVFPETRIFQGNRNDLLLVGAREPVRPDWPAAEATFGRPGVRADLHRIGLDDLASVLWMEMMSPAATRVLASAAPGLNTQDTQRLAHQAPVDMFQNLKPERPVQLDERFRASPALLLADYLRRSPEAGLPSTLRALFQDARIGWEPLATEASMAFLLSTGAAPASFGWTWRPLTDDQLAAELQAGDAARVDQLWSTYDSEVLLRARLDPSVGRAWLARPVAWSTVSSRRQRIDLLMAVGETDAAGAELRRWMDEPVPPAPDWAVATACAAGPGPCAAVVDACLRRAPTPELRELRALLKRGA